LAAHARGEALSWGVRWMALIAHFVLMILDTSIFGHKFIAVCRMAGFNAFRNTYRPLESTSIAEFYNRYHWYFKELLVTFFFFPTYLRYFKKHPRVRMVFATMAAACFGNALYHFLLYDRDIFEYGLRRALVAYHPFAIYTVILGVAISVSQLRTRAKGHKPTGRRKVLAIAGVMLFFCLLSILQETNPALTVADYLSYFVSLFRP
jgi:D-alanyl-lipoteichoic acid acyltransferase DltB (MBOAT superfamily)